jgi:hypothetical protein
MTFEFLEPVKTELQEIVTAFSNETLANFVSFYNGEENPNLEGIDLAVICVKDARQSLYEEKADFYYDKIRKQLYQMYVGNWKLKIIDLGDVEQGDEVSDTAYVFRTVLNYLYSKSIVPIILGGGQDFTFYQYRAYDGIKYMVNLSTADHKFDLGNSDLPLDAQSFVGKMITSEPYNLFNYCNLGYQTFLSSLEEINLMERLFFEAVRLGELKQDFKKVEPMLRDTDLLSIDMYSVKSSEIGDASHKSVNGFNSLELCQLSRYAGMSDKLSSFGVYELQALFPSESLIHLVSQMLWYFIEGYSLRLNEKVTEESAHFVKYSVPIDNEILIFLKSEISERWWIKIPNENNNVSKPSLLACDKQDYLDATASILPERWLKAKYKNNI